ncbi:DUF1993 domain-containing protein [Pararobbsia silviterrae]|uniref:DUF1993 domain-containing protein n=1 Tax=Pararobbsia silviterrae TaxID=1792498 RepID=A0A494Y1K3_9BURK|nr:DUF1993 domain-containing protein [Pararobbsia silviterrae]RKP56644.1 DUF1993 domain-containing protein [Pararobbsia silviterrae]
MSISIYEMSVPVFIRGLRVLSTLIDKAEAYAEANQLAPAILLDARLAPDMMSLTGQVQRASDTSKLSGQRLSGVAAPRFEDNETTFNELQQRIAKTVAYLETLDPASFADAESRVIQLNFGEFKPNFTGVSYLLTFAIPNFFFHVTTAHDILRHNGLPIGKRDFLGPFN